MKPNILHHKGLAFVIIPKCAGTSVKFAIREGMGHDESQRIHIDDRLNYTRDPGNMFVVAFIRNPFDRLVSTYKNKIKERPEGEIKRLLRLGYRKDMTFAEFALHASKKFAAEGHAARQKPYLPNRVDLIARFENIREVWPVIQSSFPWLPDLPHKNATNKDDWRSYYDDATMNLVAETYKEDIELWESI